MFPVVTPPRAAIGGTAVLMACACGAADHTARLLGLTGMAVTTTMVHPVFLGAAAALIVWGLWRISPRSGQLAALAFVVMAAAAALTPPRVMTLRELPWNSMQMMGGGLYLVAAALLAYGFWRAFPFPNPAASGTAMSGVALSTGCSCCLFTGALAGMSVTSGAPTLIQSSPVIFWTGIAIVSFGLFRMAGPRAAVWAPVGAVVIRYAPELLRLTGDWMVGPANLRTFPSFMITITGAGLILYGFVVAYRIAGQDGRMADRAMDPTSSTAVGA